MTDYHFLNDLPDSTTLGELRKLIIGLRGDGVICPACDLLVKVYDRKINPAMARSLIKMYRIGGTTDFVHLPTQVGARSREEGKLAYWGLTEPAKTDSGAPRAGYWRVTPLGEQFVRRSVKVHRSADVFGGNVRRLHGVLVDIVDCLGDRWNYTELMMGSI